MAEHELQAAGAVGGGAPTFSDWSDIVRFRPAAYLRPTSMDELKGLLSRIHAGEFGEKRARVPGSFHSCSAISVSDIILDVSGLPKTIQFDDANTAVTVSANWTLHEFLQELGARGKSVTATGGTDHQTLAGLISTGTAPASSRYALYELLDWVEYVTVDPATGQVVEARLSRGEAGFGAAVCSLGALGVITLVRFRLVDQLYFRAVQKIVPLKDLLADLDKTSEKYDFWRVNWLPKSDRGLLWAATRIPREEADPEGDYPRDQSENILDVVFQVLDRLTNTGPLLDFPLEMIYHALAAVYGRKTATGPLRNMLPVDRRAPLHVAMAEWSFAPADLDRVLQECRRYFGRHGWPNIPTEIELTRTDQAFMSPWNWEGLPYIVKFNFMYLTEVLRRPDEKEAMFRHLRGLWDHLQEAGIPFKAHWGKINFMDPDFVRQHLRLDDFRPHMSPMFLNQYLAERIEARVL